MANVATLSIAPQSTQAASNFNQRPRTAGRPHISMFQRSATSEPKPTVAANTKTAPAFQSRCVIVDGLNLILLNGRFDSQLTTLLTVLVELTAHVQDMLCICDANTFYVLKERDPKEAAAYSILRTQFSRFFMQPTGGNPADDFILPEARDRQALIVSRDRYQNPTYLKQYPWVTLPGRVLRVNVFRETLYIGADYSCKLSRDLPGLMNILMSRLEHMLPNSPSAA